MKRAAIFQRLVFLSIVLSFVFKSDYRMVAFTTVILLSTIVIGYLDKHYKNFRTIEAFFLFLFIACFVAPVLGYPLSPSTFGTDKVFHFLAGVLTGFAGSIIISDIEDKKLFYLSIVCFTCTVGVAWEVFEWMLLGPQPYVDTLLDILYVTLGSFVAIIHDTKLLYRNNKSSS